MMVKSFENLQTGYKVQFAFMLLAGGNARAVLGAVYPAQAQGELAVTRFRGKRRRRLAVSYILSEGQKLL